MRGTSCAIFKRVNALFVYQFFIINLTIFQTLHILLHYYKFFSQIILIHYKNLEKEYAFFLIFSRFSYNESFINFYIIKYYYIRVSNFV